MLKGLDPNDYGINNLEDLKEKQREFSKIIKQMHSPLDYPNYEVKNIKKYAVY